MPRREHKTAQSANINCLPWSVVIVAGTPYLESQVEMKESEQVAASMLHMGQASSQRVVLSTMVRR